MIIVVSYDVVCEKRRNRIHKILRGYGENVQDSLFECDIDDRLLNSLVKKLAKVVDVTEDDLRIYHLCAACRKKAIMLGKAELSQTDEVIIF